MTPIIHRTRAERRRAIRARVQGRPEDAKPAGPGRKALRAQLRAIGATSHKRTTAGAPKRTSLLYLLNKPQIDHVRTQRALQRQANKLEAAGAE